jgi:hypothetical protein
VDIGAAAWRKTMNGELNLAFDAIGATAALFLWSITR